MKFLASSYAPTDVQFLLSPSSQTPLSLAEKEALLSRGAHYSQMLSLEDVPSPVQQQAFEQAISCHRSTVQQGIAVLAQQIYHDALAHHHQPEIVLLSLARAGTPVGALIKRRLDVSGVTVWHYSLSIVRDKGIDANALLWVTKQHHNNPYFAFIDGWTGKGTIARELQRSITVFNHTHHTQLHSRLYCLTDPSGTAYFAPTHEDYLVPHATLNATVSGLISRTLRQPENDSAGQWDQAVYLQHLKDWDVSEYYLEQMQSSLGGVLPQNHLTEHYAQQKIATQHKLQGFIDALCQAGIDWLNIKPGIGESTRALLRRTPKLLYVQQSEHPDVDHLLQLARLRHTDIHILPDLPCQAMVIVGKAEIMEKTF